MAVATQQEMIVKKRDGRVISFDRELIARAVRKAFRADMGLAQDQQMSPDLLTEIERITEFVVQKVKDQARTQDGIDVERIQDVVEQELMRAEHYAVARRYILYRAERKKVRQLRAEERMESTEPFPSIMVNRNGCLLYTSPSPRDRTRSRMPSSA